MVAGGAAGGAGPARPGGVAGCSSAPGVYDLGVDGAAADGGGAGSWLLLRTQD